MYSATFESVSPLYRLTTAFREQLWLLWLIIAIPMVMLGARSAALHSRPNTLNVAISNIASKVQFTPAASSVDPSAPTTIASNLPPTIPTAASIAVAPLQSCTPASKNQPAQLELSNQPAGLTQVNDSITYQVYGNNASQVRKQIQLCSPTISGYRFAGETHYNLTWQYGATDDGTGMCTIGDVKVGLHSSVTLPSWQPTAAASSSFATNWQSFVRNLKTHEDGHVAINQQYAQIILRDLQSLPKMSCVSLANAMQSNVQLNVNALNAANNGYDASTNHGATQGAIIP